MTYQRNTLMAILENWQQVKDAQDVVAESMGSTEEKYAAYMDGMEAHINQLTTAWSEFLLNINAAEIGTTFISAVTGLVQALDVIINKTPLGTAAVIALTLALTRLAAVKFAGLASNFSNIATVVTTIGGSLKSLQGLSKLEGLKAIVENLKTVFTGLGKFATGAKMADTASDIADTASNMTELAKGSTAVQKAMAKGGNGLAKFGSAAVNAMAGATGLSGALTGVGAGAGAATGGIAALGSALSALAPYILAIVGIGVAIKGVAAIADELIVTDEELAESIEQHTTSIEESKQAIEDYSTTLEQNKERIEEINALKGTSSWTTSLAEEEASLQRQNEALERRIQLEEQMIEIEQRQLARDDAEQYRREYAGAEYWSPQADGNDQKFTGTSAIVQEARDNTKNLETYKEAMEEAERASAKAAKASGEQRKAYQEEAQAALERADNYVKRAEDEESAILEQIQTIQELKAEYEDKADTSVDPEIAKQYEEQAKGLEKVLNGLYTLPTTDLGFATIGESLGFVSEEAGNAAKSVDQLKAEIQSMSQVAIGDDIFGGFSDSFLNQFDYDTLVKLHYLLEQSGGSASALSEVLGSMDGADAIALVGETYKDFLGIVSDNTEAVTKFKEALNEDFNDKVSQITEMSSFLAEQNKGGITNREAYKQAQLGIYGRTDLSADQMEMYDKSFNSYLKDGAVNADLLKSRLQEVNKETSGLVELMYDQTGESLIGLTVKDLSQLGNELDLTEPQLQALLRGIEGTVEVNVEANTTRAQQNLQNVLADIQAVNGKRAEVAVAINAAQNGEGDLDTVKQKLQEYITLANEAGKPIGLQLDADLSGIETVDQAKEKLSEINTAIQYVQSTIDASGNWDFSGLAEALQGLELPEGVTIDDNLQVDFSQVDLDSEGAQEQIITALDSVLADVPESLQPLMLENMAVEWNMPEGLAESIASKLNLDISTAMSSQEIALGDSMKISADKLGIGAELLGAIETAKSQIATIGTAVTTASSQANTSHAQGQLSSVGSQAASANSQVSALQTRLNNIGGTYNVKINITTSGSIPTNIPGTKSANGNAFANGVDAYANGGQPLRSTKTANSLVGEEGPEYKISKDGTQELVGQNGPELITVERGDTIIPANVTKMIRQGKIAQYAEGKTGNTSSSSSSSASDDPWKEAAEAELDYLEHQLNMKYIDTQRYLQRTDEIYKKYYANRAEYIEEDRELQEKIFDIEGQLIEEWFDELEFNINNLQRANPLGNAQEIQNTYLRMLDRIHAQANSYRERGFAENSQEIRDLQKQYQDLLDDMIAAQSQIFDNQNNWFQHNIDILNREQGTQQKQAVWYLKALDNIHAEAEYLRNLGYAEESPEIIELQQEYWDLQMKYEEMLMSIYEQDFASMEHYLDDIEHRIEQLPEFVDDYSLDSDALGAALDAHTKAYFDLAYQQLIQYRQQAAATQAEIDRLVKISAERNKEQIRELNETLLDIEESASAVIEAMREAKLEEIQTELDRHDELRDAMIWEAENQKEALEEQLELLREQNEEKEDAITLEKLQQNLENAKNNKYKRVWFKDRGWVWMHDQAAVDEAEEELNDFKLEQQEEELQDQIDNWNDYIEKLEESSDVYQKEIYKQILTLQYGENYSEKIWKDMNDNLGKSVDEAVGLLDNLQQKYKELYEEMAKYEQMKEEALKEDFDIEEETKYEYVNGEYIEYDPNFDYAAAIKNLEKEKQWQIDKYGTYETRIDDQIAKYEAQREAKKKGNLIALIYSNVYKKLS